MSLLTPLVPLSVIEASHFLASLTGLGLVVLARALRRRVDAGYWLALGLLAGGACFSLLKGFDYEEAIGLTLSFGVLLPYRTHFYRKASLFSPRVNLGWLGAIIATVFCSVWLGLFAYKHVEYSHELWWQFSIDGDASRILRASLGIFVLTFALALARLLRPAQIKPEIADEQDLATAASLVKAFPETRANLALLGDKAILFSETRTAFIMYAVEGKSWIAMGDPVGAESKRAMLVWSFRELCDQHGGWPVFYQIRAENVYLYLDVGLVLFKLGEEARVNLDLFSLDGSAHKEERYSLHRLEKDGYTFQVVAPQGVPAILPELKAISDAWLQERHTREKRFSLGFFSETYLRRYPQALVVRDGRIVAFANLWQGADYEELSIDLMRHRSDAPKGVMDYLFIRLMIWGKEQGYHWFNLGMATFAGLECPPVAPLWNRFGTMVFRHGEHFYNFQGLRQYKDKFHPVWEPRYLALPGKWYLPPILKNIASLIAGGVIGIVRK